MLDIYFRMPWRGDRDSMIDRFDVRAHLDDIPAITSNGEDAAEEEVWEERQCNYERYRIIIQNDFLGGLLSMTWFNHG